MPLGKFILMRRDPNSKLFGDWRIVERFNDFNKAVQSRERRRWKDKQFEDERWEYQIDATE